MNKNKYLSSMIKVAGTKNPKNLGGALSKGSLVKGANNINSLTIPKNWHSILRRLNRISHRLPHPSGSVYFFLIMLQNITNTNLTTNYSIPNTITNIKKLRIDFLKFRQVGYVSRKSIENHPILNLMMLIFKGNIKGRNSRSKSVNNKKSNIPVSLEDLDLFKDLFNLILLIIIQFSLNENESLSGSEEYFELILLKKVILNKLSPNMRKDISKNRFSINQLIYTGFDTEFQTTDFKTADLLCATMAVNPRVEISIKSLTVSKNSSSLFQFLIFFLRDLSGKDDYSMNCLINTLKQHPKLKSLRADSGMIFSKSFVVDSYFFITKYIDLRENRDLFSFRYMHDQSVLLAESNIKKHLEEISGILSEYGLNYKRLKTRFNKKLFLIAHYSPAELGFFTDFEEFKDRLSIINKCFITLGRGFKIKDHEYTIILRDTNLLTPAGSSSLGAIGKMYSEDEPDLEKLDLPKEYRKDEMERLMNEKPEAFQKYAIRDSVITLYHALRVEETSFEELRKLTIPVTLSSLAGGVLNKAIGGPEYELPLHDKDILKTSIQKLYTPGSLQQERGLGRWLVYFLGAYKGGRNESFMYGGGKFTKIKALFDYDLTSAYPTVMSLLDFPAYLCEKDIPQMTGIELLDLYGEKLIMSYTAVFINFKFPNTVKFPNLPVKMSDGTLAYPLSGQGYFTGVEIFYAISSLKAEVEVLGGSFIPFLGDKTKIENSSVLETEVDLQFASHLPANNPDYFEKYTSNFEKGMYLAIENIVKDNPIPENIFLSNTDDNCLKVSKNDKLINNGVTSEGPNTVENLQAAEIKNQSVPSAGEEARVSLEPQSLDLSYQELTEALSTSKEVFEKFDNSHGISKTRFYNIVDKLVKSRKEHPKKSYENLYFKFLSNSGIGSMARGLSGKTTYNPSIKDQTSIPTGPLTNPLYSGWVTAFVRTTLSEILNHVNDKNGIVISCTTDGFISDLEGLEKDLDSGIFSQLFTIARKNLRSSEVLEIKYTETKGLVSWTTRGQLALESGLKATTGYQPPSGVPNKIWREEFFNQFTSYKEIFFGQFSLIGGNTIIKSGGQVSPRILERKASFYYDNRREITPQRKLDNFVVSSPHSNCETADYYRWFNKIDANQYLPGNALNNITGVKSQDSFSKHCIRQVIRGFYHSPELFGLTSLPINRQEIQSFIKSLGVVVTLNYISQQKPLKFLPRHVPKTAKTTALISLIKTTYPLFNEDLFFRR